MGNLTSLLPKPIRQIVSEYRTLLRSRKMDQLLKREHPARLRQKHVEKVRLFPSREEFLHAMPKGGLCVEVGVAEGAFSRMILDIMKPDKLILIDLWSADSHRYSKSMEVAKQAVKKELELGIVEIRRGWSWEMLETLGNQSADWIYIDAHHEYDSVKKDLDVTIRKIKPSGIIAGHDYTRWSSQAINRWGVVEAVNETCIEHDWQFRYMTAETHQHVSFGLQSLKSQQNYTSPFSQRLQ